MTPSATPARGDRVGDERHPAARGSPGRSRVSGARWMPSRMIETTTSSRASAAPTMPGSRCRNGRIALKRCVTLRAPRSNAAFACAAFASVCPSETATPRSSSRSISASAPGSSGASVISRTGPASSRRSSSARSGSRRADASCVPSRLGERNGPFEVHAEDARARLAGRDLSPSPRSAGPPGS